MNAELDDIQLEAVASGKLYGGYAYPLKAAAVKVAVAKRLAY